MADLQKLVVRLEAETARYKRELDSARTKLGGLERSMGAVSKASQRLNSMLSGAALALAARQVTVWADSYTNLQNRLKLVTDSQEELAGATKQVFDIAQRSRADLAGTSEVYFKIAQNADALKLSQDEVARATETFAKSIALSGTSAQGAAGGITQFGQALAAGIVRAEEFNSISEASPAFIDALGRSLGKTRGELRKFVNDGLLESGMLTKALLEQSATINAEYAKTSATVEQSMTKLSNSFVKLVGDFESATGTFEKIAELISGVADAIAEVSAAAEAFPGLSGLDFDVNAFNAFGPGLGQAAKALLDYRSAVQQVKDAPTVTAPSPIQTGMSMIPEDTGMSVASDSDVAAIQKLIAEQDKLASSTSRATTTQVAAADAVADVAEAYDFQAEAQEDAADWSAHLDDLYRQNEAAILGVDYATLRYNDTLGELSTLLQNGVISQQQFEQATKKAAENLDTYANAVRDMGLQLQESIKGATSNLFQDLITDGQNWKDHLINFFDQISAAFAKMAADMAAQAIFGTTGGSGGGIDWAGLVGGLVGGLFGAAAGGGSTASGFDLVNTGGSTFIDANLLASGGVMNAGQFTVVGEEGPELVMSRTSRHVLNNDDTMGLLGGSGGNTLVQNFAVKDFDSFHASRRQVQRTGKMALGIQV